MRRNTVAAVSMAALLVLAGCSSVLSPGMAGGGTGTVNFYMSDQPGAIHDFEHLNVTVDSVTFVKENGNQTTVEANQTVDLTQLQGSNASLVDEYDVESGNYSKVFMSVGDIEATYAGDASGDVKLPSEKLQLNQNFTVESNESVDFVYDVMVTKAGGSGKYVIRPVVSESGTDVQIDEVDASVDAKGGSEGGMDGNASMAERQGSMEFYVSDQQNAIDDFEHLNVTISQVEFHRSGDSGVENGSDAANGSEMENDSEMDDGQWVTYDVNDTSVDLTELKGDNATLLQRFDLTAGNYTSVVVHVEDVNGTLHDGNSTDVKLPSNKLRLNENFRVESNESVEFVYDITVVERGNQGYNVRPVASESGTDVPIKKVDDRGDDHEADETAGADTQASLNATFVGNVSAGENATVSATRNGTAVANATVTYDDTEYATGDDGEVTFAVPENASAIEVTVTYEDGEVELEHELESQGNAPASENGRNGNGQNALAEP